MIVLMLGATGALGRHTVPRLLERGHRVRAIVRSEEQAAQLAALGVEPYPGDILDAASLQPAANGCDAALHLATSIPRVGGRGEWALNDRIRREGTRNLLAAAVAGGVRRYVQQSITLLYGQHEGALVDESFALAPSAAANSAGEMEAQVQASPLEWCILRGGQFYGPGTGAEDAWRARLAAGQLMTPEGGNRPASLVHVVDYARAVVAALEQAPAQSVFNVVDDEPVSYADLYGWLALQAGRPAPAAGGTGMAWPACSNASLKAATDWRPAFPSYRSGLAG